MIAEILALFAELQEASRELVPRRARPAWFRAARPRYRRRRILTAADKDRLLLARAAADAERWHRTIVPPRTRRRVSWPLRCRMCGAKCARKFCSPEHYRIMNGRCVPPADSYYVRSGEHAHYLLSIMLGSRP